MGTMRSGRNKTIDTSLDEGQVYLKRCVAVTKKQDDLLSVSI